MWFFLSIHLLLQLLCNGLCLGWLIPSTMNPPTNPPTVFDFAECFLPLQSPALSSPHSHACLSAADVNGYSGIM